MASCVVGFMGMKPMENTKKHAAWQGLLMSARKVSSTLNTSLIRIQALQEEMGKLRDVNLNLHTEKCRRGLSLEDTVHLAKMEDQVRNVIRTKGYGY